MRAIARVKRVTGGVRCSLAPTIFSSRSTLLVCVVHSGVRRDGGAGKYYWFSSSQVQTVVCVHSSVGLVEPAPGEARSHCSPPGFPRESCGGVAVVMVILWSSTSMVWHGLVMVRRGLLTPRNNNSAHADTVAHTSKL